jgi:predicted RNA-binding Zn ribbon-like protein
MYPTTQSVPSSILAGVAQGYSSQLCQAEQPSSGIASRVGELQKAVAEICEAAYNIRGALGILVPTEVGKNAVAPSSLTELLLSLRHQLTQANSELRDVLTHINS